MKKLKSIPIEHTIYIVFMEQNVKKLKFVLVPTLRNVTKRNYAALIALNCYAGRQIISNKDQSA